MDERVHPGTATGMKKFKTSNNEINSWRKIQTQSKMQAHDENSQETIDKLYTLQPLSQKYLQALMERKNQRKKSSAINLKVDEKELACM